MLASASEIGVLRSISYTVSVIEYTGITTDLIGTFNFLLECPLSVVSSTIDSPISVKTEYDISSWNTLSLPLPLVSVTPSLCFSVDLYVVYDTATGIVPNFITVDIFTIDILTQDKELVGTQSMTFNAITNNGEYRENHDFTVTFLDYCEPVFIQHNLEILTNAKMHCFEQAYVTLDPLVV